MADTNFVLSPIKALNALGYEVTFEQTFGARGQAQSKASAIRDGDVKVVSLRDSDGEAVDALVQSITMPEPARRTRRRG